jgi:fatty-acyl-CoA synthase
VEDPSFPARDLGSLRVIYCGGTHVQPELVRRIEDAFGAPVFVAYGQSESPWITMTSPGDSYEDKARSIGRPMWHREVKIVDPVTLEPVGIGEVGEVCTRSPMMMQGYVGAAAGEPAFDGDGWLHTGDLACMNGDGVIYFRGRSRDVIIRGGENVYPIEVERVIVQHPAVDEVAVVGQSDTEWGEIVAAWVRVKPGESVTTEELEALCRSRLASFKVPRRWFFVDAFPVTAAGKIKKDELKEAAVEEAHG